jgi:hypothetical protein
MTAGFIADKSGRSQTTRVQIADFCSVKLKLHEAFNRIAEWKPISG